MRERMAPEETSTSKATSYAVSVGLIVERAAFVQVIQSRLDGHEFDWVDVDSGIRLGTCRGRRIAVAACACAPPCAIRLEQLKKVYQAEQVIRIGTCGGLQPTQRVGEIVVATEAIRGEGTSACYVEAGWPATADFGLTHSFEQALIQRGMAHHIGTVWSTDGRYVESDEATQRYSELGVLAIDMESSALFVVGRLRGVRIASVGIISDLPINDLGQQVKGMKTRADFQNTVMPVVDQVVDLCLEVSLGANAKDASVAGP